MAFSKKFHFADSELHGISTQLMKKFSNLDKNQKVNISVELTALLKVLFYGSSFDKLHENYKLKMFYFLKPMLGFTETWSAQNGINFKDKICMALALRIMCFNPDTEVISVPQLKGKVLYDTTCNILQRNLGFQEETLKGIVYQGITGFVAKSDVSKRIILYLPSTLTSHGNWKGEEAVAICKVISQWFLLHCNQSNTSSSGKKSAVFQSPVVCSTTEVDGKAARGIFTILNIASSYHGDRLMNIYAFAVLKQWIIFVQGSHSVIDSLTNTLVGANPLASSCLSVAGSNTESRFSPLLASPSTPLHDSRFYDMSESGSDSADTQSIASSFVSVVDSVYVDDLYSDTIESSRATSPCFDETQSLISNYMSKRSSFDTMSVTSDISSYNIKHIAIKYCLRVMSQSEKVPRRSSDRSVVTAAVVECVQILDALCDNVTAISQKAFTEIKRLYSRIESKPLTTRRVYVVLVEFFIHHYESMVVEMDEVLEVYFTEIPLKLYDNQTVAFEILQACLNNKEFFQTKSKILSTYFPNIFKLFAWWPFSFLEESCEIIGLFTKAENALEVLHCILDLPTLSALLYLKHNNILEDNDKLEEKLGTPIKDYFNAMFCFFLREKSGGGETIDKLSELHIALELLGSHPRVRYASDIVPAMLLSFFSVIEQCKDTITLRNIFAVVLERCFQLYPANHVVEQILEMFAEHLQRIAKICRDVVSYHFEEILTFFTHINSTVSTSNQMLPVVCIVIWCVGEYAPNSHCSRKQVTVLYETLETMLYEGSSELGCSSNILGRPEVITNLVSTLSKLATYSQELIPRTIVSLNKICRRKHDSYMVGFSAADRLAVTTFAEEMIHLLHKPKVAPAVLCDNHQVIPWHLHTHSSLSMKIHVLCDVDVV